MIVDESESESDNGSSGNIGSVQGSLSVSVSESVLVVESGSGTLTGLGVGLGDGLGAGEGTGRRFVKRLRLMRRSCVILLARVTDGGGDVWTGSSVTDWKSVTPGGEWSLAQVF